MMICLYSVRGQVTDMLSMLTCRQEADAHKHADLQTVAIVPISWNVGSGGDEMTTTSDMHALIVGSLASTVDQVETFNRS